LASLLDTDVASQRIKDKPHADVMRWTLATSSEEVFLSVMSLQEIRFGIERMSAGKKRDKLEAWLGVDLPRSFVGRILPVDERIAELAGRITAHGKNAGAEPEIIDALIAATARIHGLKVATLNRKHFAKLGVELVEF
jgi:predicted nucleic acid-binding protein